MERQLGADPNRLASELTNRINSLSSIQLLISLNYMLKGLLGFVSQKLLSRCDIDSYGQWHRFTHSTPVQSLNLRDGAVELALDRTFVADDLVHDFSRWKAKRANHGVTVKSFVVGDDFAKLD